MDDSDFLGETELIDTSHPSLIAICNALTSHLISDRDKACSIYNFVRDNVKFGWCSNFSAMKASEVLEARLGYGITKSTLFVAMLRIARIPARIIFIDLNSSIFSGLGFTDGTYVDHSYSEVYLDGRWVKLDGYTVDRELFVRAQERLTRENLKVGYAVHQHGHIEWDGDSDCFVQYVEDSYFPNISSISWGYHPDASMFYRTVPNAHNNFDIFFPLTALFFLYFYFPNLRADSLRRNELS